MIDNLLKVSTYILLLVFGLTELHSQTDKTSGKVADIDGNVYKTVNIGNQIWMAENLKTTKYSNGDSIGTTYPATQSYANESTPKYQWAYNGNDSLAVIYGRLYTWFVATDKRNVCPTGWHVPTITEWKTLINFLGGENSANGKLKETGTTHWKIPNSDATNESGFTGLPGGTHWSWRDTTFKGIGTHGHYWSASEDVIYDGSLWCWRILLYFDKYRNEPFIGTTFPSNAWAIRCLKD